MKQASNHELIARILKAGWCMPHHCQSVLKHSYAIYMSESSVSRRIRELREDRYGCIVKKRLAKESNHVYEYKVETRKAA